FSFDFWNPGFINFVAGEFLDKGFAWHMCTAHTQFHDGALFATYAFEYVAHSSINRLELTRRQFEKLEQVAQRRKFFFGLLAVAAMLGQRFFGFIQLLFQFVKADTGFLGVNATDDFVFLVSGGVVFFLFVSSSLFTGSGNRGLFGFDGWRGNVDRRIEPADNNFGQAALFRGYQGVF